MPRRCRGVRGDVGIAPYGRFIEVRSYNVSPSVMVEGHDTSLCEGGGDFRACGRGRRIPTPVTSVTGSE